MNRLIEGGRAPRIPTLESIRENLFSVTNSEVRGAGFFLLGKLQSSTLEQQELSPDDIDSAVSSLVSEEADTLEQISHVFEAAFELHLSKTAA